MLSLARKDRPLELRARPMVPRLLRPRARRRLHLLLLQRDPREEVVSLVRYLLHQGCSVIWEFRKLCKGFWREIGEDEP